MAIPWTVKKQLTFLSAFILIIVAGLFLIFISLNKPSCSDGKQNQAEEGIDCGGPCQACLGRVRDIIVVWSKVFKLDNGKYEAAVLVKNPNLSLALPLVNYKIKLYDRKNILVAVREGETFINPGGEYVFFETNIDVGKRFPVKAFVEFNKNLKWEKIETKIPQIVVSSKSFTPLPFPRLSAEISNTSIFPVEGVFAVAVLYDKDGSVMAVSSTKIKSIEGNSAYPVVFTWPTPFEKKAVSSHIFLRVNLTHEK